MQFIGPGAPFSLAERFTGICDRLAARPGPAAHACMKRAQVCFSNSRFLLLGRLHAAPDTSRASQRAAETAGKPPAPSWAARRRSRLRRMAAAAEAAPAGPSASHPLLRALAVPPDPDFQLLGARVEHVIASREGLASELVTEALCLPEGAADLLLRFGAIHTCPVPPLPPPAALAGMPEAEAKEAHMRRAAVLQRVNNDSRACVPQRLTADAEVPWGSYLRVHLHPKRFPAAWSVDWKERVVADTPGFVVVSKPGGVPAAPTIDNLIESAPACTAQAIGRQQPLQITSRLDQCTEGLLVLGKTKDFVRQFNELVKRGSGNDGKLGSSRGGAGSRKKERKASRRAGRGAGGSGAGEGAEDGSRGGQDVQQAQDSEQEDGSSSTERRRRRREGEAAGSAEDERAAANGDPGTAAAAADADACQHCQPSVPSPAQPPRALRKFYRAATSAPPPLGPLRHHLSTERRHAGLPAFTIAHEEPVEGSLPAELVVLEVQPVRLTEAAALQLGAAQAHECLIELITGRTHQIRSQLSAAGCPLLGDRLYEPLASPELRQRLFAHQPSPGHVPPTGDERLLQEPAGAIGLQACRLEVADPLMGGSPEQPAVFEAGAPWWRA